MSTPTSTQSCAAFYAAQHAAARGTSRLAAGPLPFHGATALDVCTRDVVTCDAGMQVGEAARLMRKHDVGALVVVEAPAPGRHVVAGLLTDRDLAVGVVAMERDLQSTRVGDVMRADVVSARADDPVASLLSLMRHKRVRRLPVTGPEGDLLGIVTMDDVLAGVAEQVHALADVAAAARHGTDTSPVPSH